MVLLPTAFLPNIYYLALIAQGECDGIYLTEPYQKQSYRSRCDLMSPNGRLSFSLPIQQYGTPPPLVQAITISEHGNWRHRLHHALKSNYHSTPYWLHYEEAILSHSYATQYNLLADYNALWLEWLCDAWYLTKPRYITNKEVGKIEAGKIDNGDDWGTATVSSKTRVMDKAIEPSALRGINFPRYWQPFERRWGFQANLSALDLLLNQGPEGRLYLLQLPLQEKTSSIIAR